MTSKVGRGALINTVEHSLPVLTSPSPFYIFYKFETNAYAQNKNTGCNKIEHGVTNIKIYTLENKREKLRANESLTFIPSDRI